MYPDAGRLNDVRMWFHGKRIRFVVVDVIAITFYDNLSLVRPFSPLHPGELGMCEKPRRVGSQFRGQ